MIKKYPALEKDFLFRSQLGLDYFSDNPFRANQEIDKIGKRKEAIAGMGALMGDSEKPFFSNAFLIEQFLGLSQQDIIANKEAKERKKKEEAKKEEEKKKDEEKGGSKEEEKEEPKVTL
jgi:hypothetical protein